VTVDVDRFSELAIDFEVHAAFFSARWGRFLAWARLTRETRR
jgi:hypothetical protein